MKKNLLLVMTLILCAAPVVQVQADVSFMAARVGAVDVLGTGEFYKRAFDLREIEHIELGDGRIELILGFNGDEGQTLVAVNAALVILSRDSDDSAEAIPHLVFRVSDIDDAFSQAINAGGSEVVGPFVYGDNELMVAMLRDPSGNIVELIEPL